MGFSKTFPKQQEGQNYPKWVEVSLSDAEEKRVEAQAREENIRLLSQCIDDASALLKEKGMKGFQSDIISLATTLFEKRSSHEVYWKENQAKIRFDELNATRK